MRIGIDARKIRDFGIGQYILALLTHLPECDEEDTFVIFHYPDDTSLIPAHAGRFELVTETSPKYSPQELVLLSVKMAQQRLNLFHAPHYTLPPIRPCRGIVTIHDVTHLRFPEYLRHPAMYYYAKGMMWAAAKSAKAVLTVSECSKQDIIRYLGVPPDKIEVIYNGLTPMPPTQKRRDDLAAQFGIRQPYLLYLGNFLPHKNAATLIQAFSLLKRRETGFPYQLVLAGKHDRVREQLLAQIQQAQLERDVVLTGFVEPEWAAALYRYAEMFVYPSKYEGFGLQALEAMACDVPVIIAEAGALPEVAGDAALRFDPNSAEQLAERIHELSSTPTLRDTLIQRGRQQMQKFSWREMAQKTAAAYRRALER